ncbi:MAG: 3-hydroxylacyl-ACP dehydratase [Betaproteobacteria bacterium]
MPESQKILDREAILALVPHQGESCLLDTVSRWDSQRIVCESRAHLQARNPYRIDGRLPAVCAVEFAAQCFALHAALKADAADTACSGRHGYLASVRSLVLLVDTLDECSGTLQIQAEEISVDRDGMLYSFSLQHQDVRIAQGRATVAFVQGAQ